MYFDDGASPPDEIITSWLAVVNQTFGRKSEEKPCIAVHCVAGLGRAPVLVAVALVEYGLDAISAVQFIRERRRGAINATQLSYLESYEPKGTGSGRSCAIM